MCTDLGGIMAQKRAGYTPPRDMNLLYGRITLRLVGKDPCDSHAEILEETLKALGGYRTKLGKSPKITEIRTGTFQIEGNGIRVFCLFESVAEGPGENERRFRFAVRSKPTTPR